MWEGVRIYMVEFFLQINIICTSEEICYYKYLRKKESWDKWEENWVI